MTEEDSPESGGETTSSHLKVSHVHCVVRELVEAIHWFETVWGVEANFTNERMGLFLFGPFSLILDAGQFDSKVTIGFHSDNCDRDYQTVVERGAFPLEPPTDRPWGARSAYLQGPGALKIEIEQLQPR